MLLDALFDDLSKFFVEPSTAQEWHQYWIDVRLAWYVYLGIAKAIRVPVGAKPEALNTVGSGRCES